MKSKEERHSEVHARALKEFDDISTAQWGERMLCREDRRFAWIPGAQYEGNWGEMFENRPKPEVNVIQATINKGMAEYRANRMDVRYIPSNGAKKDSLAIGLEGLYRADAKDSGAQDARDVAFDEAYAGGIGAWRLTNAYEDDSGETDYQRIRWVPIPDADLSVYFDLNCKKADKSDATKCFVLSTVTATVARELYGIDVTTWPAQKELYGWSFDWYTPDVVYLAEYYEVEEKKDVLLTFTMLDGSEEKRKQSELSEDELDRYEVLRDKSIDVKERKIKTKRVHKYLLSGSGILEDYGYIAGPNIPVVVVTGKTTTVGGIERYIGAVRYAKDLCRLKNMQTSILVELTSKSPMEKHIFTPEQIAGHEMVWATANTEDPAFLTINASIGPNGEKIPPQMLPKSSPPNLPPALVALLQTTQQDLMGILGDSQQAEKLLANTSAQAVQLTQTRLDERNFIYMDNMAKAVRRDGVIWLGMACEIYAGDDRVMKIIDEMEEVGSVDLAEMEMVDGQARLKYDFARCKMDVDVIVGPASQSRRQQTAQDLIQLMSVTQDPQDQAVLNAMIMLNIDGEGVHQLKDYYRKKLLMAGAIKPNEEEQKMLNEMAQQEQKPDPQAEYLMAQALKAIADAEKAKAEAMAVVQDSGPESQQIKAQIEAAKYQVEIEKAQIEAQAQEELRAFEREKMQLELEKQVIEIAARKQELEMQLQMEAVKGQASIDVAQSTAQSGKEDQIAALNAQIENLAAKMSIAPQQPIVIQSGGKTFEIKRTPNGYKGQITE